MGKIVNAFLPFLKGVASIGEGWASMFYSPPSCSSGCSSPTTEFTDADKQDADAIRGDWEKIVGKWGDGDEYLKERQRSRLKHYNELANKRFHD